MWKDSAYPYVYARTRKMKCGIRRRQQGWKIRKKYKEADSYRCTDARRRFVFLSRCDKKSRPQNLNQRNS